MSCSEPLTECERLWLEWWEASDAGRIYQLERRAYELGIKRRKEKRSLEIVRLKTTVITPLGLGTIFARVAGSTPAENSVKRARRDIVPIAAVDGEGRRFNFCHVVVNFANVGASYAKKVLKRDGELELFDWEGVRRCVTYLATQLGLKVTGVIYENFKASDSNSKNKVSLPDDIRKNCDSIEETPRIIGINQRSADDEMTIKCAYHRNCRFMDNDNYRDWKQFLRDEKIRTWLHKCQDLLHMRYYFDSSMGIFETLDGNAPTGFLALEARTPRR